MSNEAPAAVSVAIPQTVESMGNSSKDFIINELNFEIKKGSAVGIVGESGVGKTTLVNLLSKLDNFEISISHLSLIHI